GEFLACKAASEVYELFGSEGFKKEDMLLPDECVYGDISFHYRTGGHDQTREDFLCYLQQADMFVK
ncbi:MAG: acetylxylan esterase, partial [Lentisphaeria bacterium]|nr:acetylxylan esterase [Lentisphaeria bacterium]